MCMLLGFSSDSRYELKGVLKNFFDYSVNHPDGWGLAVYGNKDKNPMVIKETVPAHESLYANMLCNNSVISKLLIAHIRYKTFGNISFNNTHPFTQRIKAEDWILAHNGSINTSYLKNLTRKPLGETDSEKTFCYIGPVPAKLQPAAK